MQNEYGDVEVDFPLYKYQFSGFLSRHTKFQFIVCKTRCFFPPKIKVALRMTLGKMFHNTKNEIITHTCNTGLLSYAAYADDHHLILWVGGVSNTIHNGAVLSPHPHWQSHSSYSPSACQINKSDQWEWARWWKVEKWVQMDNGNATLYMVFGPLMCTSGASDESNRSCFRPSWMTH